MNLAAWLWRAGRAHPEAPAVGVGAADVLSYGELAARSASIADALASRHTLAPGDRVAIVAKNHPSYVEALFGAWWGGFVAVPVNPKLHASEIGWIVEQLRSACGLRQPGPGAHGRPARPRVPARVRVRLTGVV